MSRVTHLADAMHRSYSSNNTAIASNWALFADGAGNVVWSPVSATVSMGSNASDVSVSSAGGASLSASAADHVHRGVRSIAAAGSNAQFGNVNLIAGSGMAITSAGSNFTFASTATGGGSSVSYGSNSNDVGTAGAAGASSLVSSADHVHRGVQSVTANGSNSTYGAVNLAAGSGIALGVSGQTVTFTSIGSGGGGGGASTPTLVDTATGYTSSGTSISVTLPAGISAGDAILVFVSCAANPTTPSGYIQLVARLSLSFINGAVYYKQAVGGDAGATLTITVGNDIADEAIVAVVRGATRLLAAVDAQASGGTQTSVSTAAASAGGLSLFYGGARGAASTLSSSVGSLAVRRTADTNAASALYTGSPSALAVALTYTSSAGESGLYAAAVTVA